MTAESHGDEYELVPVGPIRKLEKKIEKLEKGGIDLELTEKLLAALSENNRRIDELVKKLTELISKINEVVAKVPAVSEAGDHQNLEEMARKLEERMSKLEKKVNMMIMAIMAKRRSAPQPAPAWPPAPA